MTPRSKALAKALFQVKVAESALVALRADSRRQLAAGTTTLNEVRPQLRAYRARLTATSLAALDAMADDFFAGRAA